MIKTTPVIRITIGIVLLTISLLLVGDLLGLVPDGRKAALEARKNLTESLALQFSEAAGRNDMNAVKNILHALVSRNNDIRSGALRSNDGRLLTSSGDHLANWTPTQDGRSTPTQLMVPIFRGKDRWATVELCFTPLEGKGLLAGLRNSLVGMLLFISVCGSGGYFFLMKRSLRELDPSQVVPARVAAAFNVLKEGVLILDENELIVLTNTSFADKLGKAPETLIGYRGSELGWQHSKTTEEVRQLPWMRVLADGSSHTGVPMTLEKGKGKRFKFMVNAAPVLDGKGKQRGVLVTLDDVTELEQKNERLNGMVTQLRVTSKQIQEQNKRLMFLATHDPMTGLLNRRAMTREFDKLFSKISNQGGELSCIMTDIDHFKNVNDTYGHATGDQVIKMVANTLKTQSRQTDLVGRYGGEEFCVVLPDLGIEQAVRIAERIRMAVKQDQSTGIQVTMSFGVSSLQFKAPNPEELVNQADKALYVAKESGRNRVIPWGDQMVADYADGEQQDKAKEKQATSHKAASPEAQIKKLTSRIQELEGLAAKRLQELQHRLAHDQQTGLPIQSLFQDRIAQALARGHRYDSMVAVLSLSVATIRRIAETLGQSQADTLLTGVSRRLTDSLRHVDTVSLLNRKNAPPTLSRIGETEFGILLTDLQQADAITWIVKRILTRLEEPFPVDTQELYVTTNIGIAISPNDGNTPEDLLKNAATARNHAQTRLGSNSFAFFSEDIHRQSVQQLQMENLLHRAIEQDEFLLYYQPKIDARKGHIVGMEALIRWQSPEMGLVSPLKFIPIAESSGLINQIGHWVLETACRQINDWERMGLPPCPVAVNCSAKQLHNAQLADSLSGALLKYQVPADRFILEITESAMMADMQQTTKVLNTIAAMGISIDIDDFGTGFSSLKYLKNFPVSHVKIDRTFIADILTDDNDVALVKSIISMSHNLGLKVIAEGVEEPAQARMLQQQGCDVFQGYLFSKPVPAAAATGLLKKQKKKLAGKDVYQRKRPKLRLAAG